MNDAHPWRYTDDERPQDARCYDCGVAYGAVGDCVVSNDVWEKINPTFHRGAGILCANCITIRFGQVELVGVQAVLWPSLREGKEVRTT